ncbi:MAG: hypothetical protein LKE37_00715 [Atopobiaceae bacterium]|nr:hypothetical protein [Atopobiaceae bacterium]
MAARASARRMHDVKAGIDLGLMACLVALPLAAGALPCVAFLVLAVLHNLLNLRWWRSLRRGGWKAPRVAQLVVTALCLALAVAACLTRGGAGTVCWLFLAASFHVGQCVWPMARAEASGHGHVRREVTPERRRAAGRRVAVASAALLVGGMASLVVLGFLPRLALAPSSLPVGEGLPAFLAAPMLALALFGIGALGAWSQEGLSRL